MYSLRKILFQVTFEIESKLHSAFSEFSIGHEWFSAEIKEEAIVAIEEYVCLHGKLSENEESNAGSTDILKSEAKRS